MSGLRELYISMGNKSKELEVNLRYLARLCLHSAVELDNYSLERGQGLEHLKEISDVFNSYQLVGRHERDFYSDFPYMPLYRAIKNSSIKNIVKHDEFALEMKLLGLELASSTENEERLKSMRTFLLNFSKELSLEEQRLKSGYLIV